MCVRRDSLQKRHRGHGLAYLYVASMFASFASRIVFAAWRKQLVPGPEDVARLGGDLFEATACWAVMNFAPTPVFEKLCGGGTRERAFRRALFIAAAIVKFRAMRGVAGFVESRSVLEQVSALSLTGAASAFSRALTNLLTATDSRDATNVWTADMGRTLREARRSAVLGTCLIVSRAASLEVMTSRLRCGGDIGSRMAPLCFDDAIDVASRTRELVLTSVLAYLVTDFASAATVVSRFKPKPPKGATRKARKTKQS